jgi:hypothetical protein
VADKKCSNSRLAKSEKCEFTLVNDSFEDKRKLELNFSYQHQIIYMIGAKTNAFYTGV